MQVLLVWLPFKFGLFVFFTYNSVSWYNLQTKWQYIITEFLKIHLQSPWKIQNGNIGLDDSVSFSSDLLHYCYKKQNCPAPLHGFLLMNFNYQ